MLVVCKGLLRGEVQWGRAGNVRNEIANAEKNSRLLADSHHQYGRNLDSDRAAYHSLYRDGTRSSMKHDPGSPVRATQSDP